MEPVQINFTSLCSILNTAQIQIEDWLKSTAPVIAGDELKKDLATIEKVKKAITECTETEFVIMSMPF